MRYQSNRSSCGPATLHNALNALGIHRTEDELIQLTGQNPTGTSAKGLIKALTSISTPEAPLHGEAVKFSTATQATIGLWYYVSDMGRPVILCVDDFDHWIVCTGHLGRRFAVIDPADNRLVLYYGATELLTRWEGPNGGWHAIVV